MISIIIPVYNREKYLNECLASVLGQDYKDIEVLLVDDGSTDKSLEICEKWAKKDARIRVFHQENKGPGSARNLALDNIKGEYVGFVDSDDLITTDMYSFLLDILLSTDSDMAICEVKIAKNGEDFIDEGTNIKQITMTTFEAMEDRMLLKGCISDSLVNKLYKASIFKDLRIVEDRILSEDTATMYKIISLCKKATYTNKVGYLLRESQNSLTRFKYDSRLCMTINTYEEMVKFMEYYPEYSVFISNSQAFANGAIFNNAGEYFKSNTKDENIKKLIKTHAKKQLKEYKLISLKNKALLWLILYAFPFYGLAYRLYKK